MRPSVLFTAVVILLSACGGPGGADPGRFCDLLTEINAQDTTGMGFDEALVIIREGRDKLVEIADVAPDEIKEATVTVTDGALAITDLLIEAGGDQTQIDEADLESMSALFTEEYTAAAGRVDAWSSQNCP